MPACGNLKSSTELVDAIIYGRDLTSEGENLVSEERFDKIRYYLKHAKYPTGADRAEKSRLRSAATHYKLIPPTDDGVPEKLMLKDKEVVSDPQTQYEIAQRVHHDSHGGINKTTAVIATKYHWVRIKETVSQVIRNCAECKENLKASGVTPNKAKPTEKKRETKSQPANLLFEGHYTPQSSDSLNEDGPPKQRDPFSVAQAQQAIHSAVAQLEHLDDYGEMAIDPQIMEHLRSQLPEYPHNQEGFAQPNMSQFEGAEEIHHQRQPQEFESGHHSQFMSPAETAAMEHGQAMDLRDERHMGNDGQIPQHIMQLQHAYVDSQGNPHLKR